MITEELMVTEKKKRFLCLLFLLLLPGLDETLHEGLLLEKFGIFVFSQFKMDKGHKTSEI